MSPLRLILITLIALCAATAFAEDTARNSDRITDDDRHLFAWFDQLGFEDFTHARLVRVRTGGDEFGRDGNGRLNDEPRGFLLWDKDGQFRVVLGDLTVATFVHSADKPQSHGYIGWRESSPGQETDAALHALGNPNFSRYWDDGHVTFADRLGLTAQAIVLARYCAANQHEDLAVRLLRAAAQTVRPDRKLGFQATLEDELGAALTWRVSLALADPHQDRHTLAALFANIVQRCPGARHADGITKTAADLEQMAVEDDAHRQLSAEELARLAPAEQARELVFQLRDDNQNFDTDLPRPWPAEPGRGHGALQKLKALGLPAVPALLDALKDSRPTRTVFRNPVFDSPATIPDIRQFALAALDDIAGFRFLAFQAPENTPADDPWKHQRDLAEDWWKTTREKGDIEWLRAQVVAGTEDAPYCLEAIGKRHPEAFRQLAVSTIPTMSDPNIRVEMLELLEAVNTPEVNALLLEELRRAPTLENRVAAAYQLRQRHQPEALAAMLTESTTLLGHLLADLTSPPLTLGDGGEPEPDSPIHLLRFLLSCDSVLAVQEVRELLPRCDPQVRGKLLEESGIRLGLAPNNKVERAGPAMRQGVEAMLVSALNDETILPPQSFGGIENIKVAEVAAETLAKCWPDKYQFNANSPPETRAAQLAAVRARAGTSSKPAGKAPAPER